MSGERASYDRVGPSEVDIHAQLLTSARAHNVEEDLPYLQRMLKQESRYDPAAVSPKGARGLMQLMPPTARWLGVDLSDWRQQIDGGVKYWAYLRPKFKTPDMIAAAYNSGETTVRKVGRVPDIPETRAYVKIVTGKSPEAWQQERAAMDALGKIAAGPDLRAPGADRPGDPAPWRPAPFRDDLEAQRREAASRGQILPPGPLGFPRR